MTHNALGKRMDTRISMAINMIHIMGKNKEAKGDTLKSRTMAIQEAHRTWVHMLQVPIARMGELAAGQAPGINEVNEAKEASEGNEETLVGGDRVDDPVPACEEHQSHRAEDVEGLILLNDARNNFSKRSRWSVHKWKLVSMSVRSQIRPLSQRRLLTWPRVFIMMQRLSAPWHQVQLALLKRTPMARTLQLKQEQR